MFYPGDTYQFLLDLGRDDGNTPSITSPPMISVIELATGNNVLSPPSQAMVAISGTASIYQFPWAILPTANSGQYLAIVSYAADGITQNGRFLEAVQVGDSKITGVVALDATCAKDVSVAKDATVAHGTDLINLSPDNSVVVLAIKAKTDNLPVAPADNTVLTAVQLAVQDVSDYALGTRSVDKTVSPPLMTVSRPAGGVLATFTITEDSNTTARNRQ